MALSASTVFQIQSTATAGNANGAGFNPANANFIADGVIALGNTSSPTLTSATYSFVAGDVGAWIYFKVQTNITTAIFVQIASVSGGVATLAAGIGQGILVTAGSIYTASLVAGVSSSASFSSVTYGVDYSQSDVSPYTGTTLTGATTTCTDVTNPFTAQMVGNLWHFNSGTGVTVGWYEIVSVSAGTATLDRSAGTTFSVVTYHGGGAASLGSVTTNQTDANLFSLGAASTTSGNIFFVKGGSSVNYALGQSVTTVAGNASFHSRSQGYASTRGDNPTDATRPLFTMASNIFTCGSNSDLMNIKLTGTAAEVVIMALSSLVAQCFITNTSTGIALYDGAAATNTIYQNELVSLGGIALQRNGAGPIMNNYIHNSTTGLLLVTASSMICGNIFAEFKTAAVSYNAAVGGSWFFQNTFYGAENKLGTCINSLANTFAQQFYNNIFYGFVTVMTSNEGLSSKSNYNCYNNNTTDMAGALIKGPNDISLNPLFTNVTQITGTTASSSGSVLSGTTGTGSLVPGTDYLYIVSGSGVTLGWYQIASSTSTSITTVQALGTHAGPIVWQVMTGHNFAVGQNLKAKAYPGLTPGNLSQGYMDIGAIQRQETSGSVSGGSYTFS